MAICPTEDQLNRQNATETMLYSKYWSKIKNSQIWILELEIEINFYFLEKLDFEEQPIRKEYCPIHGKFTFTYDLSDGLANRAVCFNRKSYIDSCPTGSALNLHFIQCSFENYGNYLISI